MCNTLPIDQYERLLRWQNCQLKKQLSTTDLYLQVPVADQNDNNALIRANTSTIILPYRIKPDSIIIGLDGVANPILRNLSDRLSYTTPIYGGESVKLSFNQPFQLSWIFTLQFTYYNLAY